MSFFGKKKKEAEAPTTPVVRTIYVCAKSVDERVGEVAHPSELLQDEPFRIAVEEIARGTYRDEELLTYAGSENVAIASLALAALALRLGGSHGARVDIVAAHVLENLNALSGTAPRFFALHVLSRLTPAPAPLFPRVIATMSDDWSDGYDRAALQLAKEFVRQRVRDGEAATFGGQLEHVHSSRLDDLATLVRKLDDDIRKPLQAELQSFRGASINLAFLREIGQIRDDKKRKRNIIEYGPQTDAATQIAELLEAQSRSVLVVGEEGVGKSVILDLATEQLRAKGWTIFEAGALELMADQMYIGQLEGRIQKLLETISGKRRVLWLIPRFHDLVLAGQHTKNETGILDLILPHIDSGSIRVAGELTSEAHQKLVERKPRVGSAMTAVRIEPASAAATTELASLWAASKGARALSDTVLEESWQLTTQYLGMRAAPGNFLELLDLTWSRLTSGGSSEDIELTIDDIIVTLSQLTGLPPSILDDREGLDLEALRAHFLSRVLGQTEAVNALVERVAMIKAAVTDPTRPFGVFLFAGPTGTGKTEIAKSLAAFLFGSPDRMIRLDMSEFKNLDSLDRLLGGTDSATSLVQSIRKQPFSVVLLDELEKAHPNVWDLFLQVFDDGRLTDRRGVTADFRHALIILTSNIGASIQTIGRTGFTDGGGAFLASNVKAALERELRKEFLNRLDRVVVFRPLARETMRGILRKELAEAFTRRGLRNRAWAVDWDESAIDFLLRQGFTPDLGARPLKRAVEQHVLAPLAEAIVNRKTPGGDQFLFVKSDGERLTMEFVDPDASSVIEEVAAIDQDERIERLVLAARGTTDEVRRLGADLRKIQDQVRSDEWMHAKSVALSMTSLPEFWSAPERFAILSEAEQRDRIESAVEAAQSLLGRMQSGNHSGAPVDVVKRIAQQLWLVSIAIEDLQRGRASDAFLLVEANGEAREFAKQLATMYDAWAKRRGMRHDVLSEKNGERYRFVAALSGFGAHTLLAQEDGVHAQEMPAAHGGGFSSLQARVRVAAQPHEPVRGALLDVAERAFAALPPAQLVVRRYREKPSPLVRDTVRRFRTGRLDAVLDGQFDVLAD